MFLNFVALLTAISISSVAAYYSIYGLTAIFSGVFWPIVIMGGVLEVGKIVTTVWLHTYWRDLRFFLKMYMSIAVVVLMFITSMGIFGFLSRAHIEVTSKAGSGDLLIQQVEMGIDLEKKRIEDSRKVITQMDEAINSLLKGSGANAERDNNRTAALTTQATKLRDSQKKERANLNATIDEANKKIAELSKEKLKLQQEDLKIQAEVGPIKYIAQLIYDDNVNQNLLEKAVRWVIIIIVAVFDPLAVCMVLGVTMVINRRRELIQEVEALAEAQLMSREPTIIEKEIEKLVVDPALIERADTAEKELAEALAMLEEANSRGAEIVEKIVEIPVEIEKIVEIEKPVEVIKEIEIIKEIETPVEVIREVPVEVIRIERVEDTAKLEELEGEIKNLLKELEQKDKLLAGQVTADEYPVIEESIVPAKSILPELDEMLAVRADNVSSVLPVIFGSEFPPQAQKSQMFLKLDTVPSQLYKFNGNKWIMVDKDQNTSYTSDAKVMKLLIDKLQSGETDWDDLTPAEQDAMPESVRRAFRA